jgi:hypothetical protein
VTITPRPPARECECDLPSYSDRFRGVLYPCESDGDGSAPFVERCDTCERFDCDEDAARWVAEQTDGIVVMVLLYGDVKRGRWQPAVYPRPEGAPNG